MRQKTIFAVALVAAAFHLYAAGWSPFTALVQRPVHLALMGLLGFLGVRAPGRFDETRPRWLSLVEGGAIVALLLSCTYLAVQNEAIVRRVGASTPVDLLAGSVAVVLVLALALRTTGTGLVAVAITALLYGLVGPWLPGILAHRGYGPVRLVEHLYLSTEGIWGIPLGVSADFVYLFILFGALLETAGGGELLIGLANRVTRQSRGGPAKTAALSSALMGSLSGSAVANVVTTGALTIPLMRRAGLSARFAAAIEAAASTGGQIMPPIMGAGAFILATWTNTPYLRVASAAAIPAILYYVALLAAIHFGAEREQIECQDCQDNTPIQHQVHLLVPLGVIVLLLGFGRSPTRAAFWGIVSVLVVSLLGSHTRIDAVRLRTALTTAAAGTVSVAAACAAAGLVVGVATLTGIGLRLSELIVSVSGGALLPALLLTAVGSIILGMGLPTTAAYVVLAALGAPALIELGAAPLAAHLFIFYFGCLSNITPPVALAAYAAAGLAGSKPLRTAVLAMSLAATGFLVPFIFVYGPTLLLEGGLASILTAALTAGAGVIALAAAMIGYHQRTLPVWERCLLAMVAIALILPGLATDGLGIVLLSISCLRPVKENS